MEELNLPQVLNLHEVFIFCWYPDGWLPRAVIADISKFDTEALAQMNTILSMNTNVVEKIWTTVVKGEGGEAYTTSHLEGYKGNDDVIHDDKELIRAINTWEQISDKHHHFVYETEDINHWIHHSYEYYIQDENSNLSPIDLHKKLLTLTCHPNNPDWKFKVKHCVISSDVPVSKPDYMTPLRFFYSSKNTTKEQIIEIMNSNFHPKDIMISSEGYGYMTPNTIEEWSYLNKKKLKIDDTVIMFD